MTYSLHEYRVPQTYNISFNLGNTIVDHSDVVGEPPVGAAPTTWLQWIGQRQLQDESRNISVLGFGVLIISTTQGVYTYSGKHHIPFNMRKILLCFI